MSQIRKVVSYVWRHPSNRGHRTRALCRAVAWQAYKRITGRPWDVTLTDDTRIRCHPGNTSASCVLYGGLYDFNEMQFMRRYLRPGDNFLDVGANVGVYALLASSCVRTGQVHAFEPSTESRTRLQENLSLNSRSNIVVHAAAASEKRAIVRLTRGNDATNRLLNGTMNIASEEVPAVTLDDEVGHLRFSMGKMDIEGGELPALKGTVQMLAQQNPPVWLLEVSALTFDFGYRAEDLLAFMGTFGYVPYTYDAMRNHLARDSEPTTSQNVLFVPTGFVTDVISRLGEVQ